LKVTRNNFELYKGDSAFTCDDCDKDVEIVVETEEQRMWLCESCAKELRQKLGWYV
jgi:ribosomal protein L37AE/L43A